MVSFITVNYNGFEATCALLRSLKENITSCQWEVIVVDNASKTDEAAAIKERFPWAKTVRSTGNLGFAGGNNLGIKEAKGDFLFFVNNDTEFFSDGVDNLCNVFGRYPDCGMVCPKVKFFNDRNLIQYAGYTPMKQVRMKNGMVGYGMKDDGSYDVPSVTSFPHGAAMMVSRKALEDVGLMPECYFLYYEELDWGSHFIEKGWTIRYEPSCTIHHKDSLTTGTDSPLKTFYMYRGRQIFAYRNFKGLNRIGSIAFTRLFAVPKRVVTGLLKGKPGIAKAAVRANIDFIRMCLSKEL
ncbi:MAG: glycosyltransferase family 2 protein [Bacteroidaceae bacterium]|nr:glycosyltransferase family 2 protein [Bacteroidaceae bacterium]